jgi:predicted regulator of Ras-like GTPase activity (Roadblock/LC7/MglB family)
MSSPQPESTSRAARLDRILHDLLHETPGIDAAAVVSFDGLPMASALPADMDEDRVAAMSAALLSLAERAAQGLGRGDLSQVYIEGEQGTVFLVSAQDEGVLVAVSAPGSKVGLMLFEVRLAAARVGDVLRAPLPAPAPETPAETPVEAYRYVQDHRVEVVPTEPAAAQVAPAEAARVETPEHESSVAAAVADQPAVDAQPASPVVSYTPSYATSSYFVDDAGEHPWG